MLSIARGEIMKRALGILAALVMAGPAAAEDLTGVWTNAWYTQLVRPKEFNALVVSGAEAEAYEAPRRALSGRLPSPEDEVGQNESEFMDQGPGLAHIRGEIRSSWIVDPADGRIPWKPEALQARKAAREAQDGSSNIEGRATDDRCLTIAGAAAPMINSPENNNLAIVQTADAVVLVGEKNHEYRIVHLDDAARLRPDLPSRLGSSVGRWEGKTLVITTTGWPVGLTDNYFGVTLTERAMVTERLSRTGPNELTYLFEVDDPNLYTRPWRGEMVFRPGGPIFEFACHEGNYAMTNMLNAARIEEESKTKAAKAAPAAKATNAASR
jgi:hypothetical protein